MSGPVRTLILGAADLARLLPFADCVDAVEAAFAAEPSGDFGRSASVAFLADGGSFHVKAATLEDITGPRFAAKVNGNFPRNPSSRGLPTIQGVLVLADAGDGRPLAIMDSSEITVRRTAATTAVAARHLSRPDARVLAVCGCGRQGRAHVEALAGVRSWSHVRVHDVDPERSRALGVVLREAGFDVATAPSVDEAASAADVIVTCTTSTKPLLDAGAVRAGTFVAGVGADAPSKNELAPALMARARVVVDDLESCAHGGDLRHALAAGAMTRGDVASDLATVVRGLGPRFDSSDVVVFDSTGLALEDVAVASRAYERARRSGVGLAFELTA